MQLIFDRGTPAERSLPVDTINELVSENRLRASLNKTFEELDDIPDTSSFYADKEFSTVDAVIDEKTIRLKGTYNVIAMLNVSYSERMKLYALNLTLEYEEKTETEMR